VLTKLAPHHPVCNSILAYRDLKKQKSTYADSLSEKADGDDKVHCTYNQNVSTGRMSGKDPNLMNIPGRSDVIRSAFVPPVRVHCDTCGWEDDRIRIPLPECPNCTYQTLSYDPDYFMLFADYSQIEVRMTGHYSQDEILLDVYNRTHEDIHTRTMCELFDISYDEAIKILSDKNHPDHKEMSQLRKVAKMTNFLIIYGGGPKNLAIQISSPDRAYTEADCRRFINTYFKRFRGVKRWIDRAKHQAMADRKLQNHFGRYRRLPELHDGHRRMMQSGEKWKVERALRQGVNYLIQGTCADLFKIAMVRVHTLLTKYRSRIIMPIHDEIAMYMHKEEIKELLPLIVTEMEDFDFRVPIVVDLAWSNRNWNEKQELLLS
jgi:DNA polymerase-1